MLKKCTLLTFIFLSIANLYPSTGRDVEEQCPLCNTIISYWKQLSYSIFTYGLDLKPMGAAHIPQPIPKCNNCGFVFIENYFSNEETQILRNSGRSNICRCRLAQDCQVLWHIRKPRRANEIGVCGGLRGKRLSRRHGETEDTKGEKRTFGTVFYISPIVLTSEVMSL